MLLWRVAWLEKIDHPSAGLVLAWRQPGQGTLVGGCRYDREESQSRLIWNSESHLVQPRDKKGVGRGHLAGRVDLARALPGNDCRCSQARFTRTGTLSGRAHRQKREMFQD